MHVQIIRQKKFNLIKNKRCEINAKVNKHFAHEKVKKEKWKKLLTSNNNQKVTEREYKLVLIF